MKQEIKTELEADLNERFERQQANFEEKLQTLQLERDQEKAKVQETQAQLARMTEDKNEVMASNLVYISSVQLMESIRQSKGQIWQKVA